MSLIQLNLLGTASGINMEHCLILGRKYKKDFDKRVVAYRLIENDKITKMFEEVVKKDYIAVEFYEKIN